MRQSRPFLVLLLTTDLLFILLHLLHVYSPYFKDLAFNLEVDRGFPEIYQYVKEFWVIVLCGWLALRVAKPYVVWSLLFLWLLADDAFYLHERVGNYFTLFHGHLAIPALGPAATGELVWFGLMGAFFLPLIAAAYLWGDTAFREVTRNFVLLLLLVAAFGVVGDALTVLITRTTLPIGVMQLAGMIEDAGELVAISLFCGYAFTLVESIQDVIRNP
jgi:hypothetical protein